MCLQLRTYLLIFSLLSFQINCASTRTPAHITTNHTVQSKIYFVSNQNYEFSFHNQFSPIKIKGKNIKYYEGHYYISNDQGQIQKSFKQENVATIHTTANHSKKTNVKLGLGIGAGVGVAFGTGVGLAIASSPNACRDDCETLFAAGIIGAGLFVLSTLVGAGVGALAPAKENQHGRTKIYPMKNHTASITSLRALAQKD